MAFLPVISAFVTALINAPPRHPGARKASRRYLCQTSKKKSLRQPANAPPRAAFALTSIRLSKREEMTSDWMTSMMKAMLQILRAALDEQRPLLLPLLKLQTPSHGWIETVRTALGMPQSILAGRLHVAKQRVSQLEAREMSGEVTLAQLRDAADALGCDFVYAFVPRRPLQETIDEKASAIALRELKAVERSMQLEGQCTPIGEERIQDYVARYISERDLWRETE